VFTIQISNVLLSNEIIPCHCFSYIDSSPPYCLMVIIYLFDNVVKLNWVQMWSLKAYEIHGAKKYGHAMESRSCLPCVDSQMARV
jgi:hypothetical protein